MKATKKALILNVVMTILVVFSPIGLAGTNDSYICTYQDRVSKDINGNELPASIMRINIEGSQADVIETSFSARSENRYEITNEYDVNNNDSIGVILTKTRSGRQDNELRSTFLSVYTIIINKENGRFTYGYIFDGLDETENVVGSCIEN